VNVSGDEQYGKKRRTSRPSLSTNTEEMKVLRSSSLETEAIGNWEVDIAVGVMGVRRKEGWSGSSCGPRHFIPRLALRSARLDHHDGRSR
jgi:hypothetical protein